MPATDTPSQRSRIRCLEADIVPTAISAEMGGTGAADQPEVDGLVHLSPSQPLKGAQVVPPEDCGRWKIAPAVDGTYVMGGGS